MIWATTFFQAVSLEEIKNNFQIDITGSGSWSKSERSYFFCGIFVPSLISICPTKEWTGEDRMNWVPQNFSVQGHV
jgi:hypothetical protein